MKDDLDFYYERRGSLVNNPKNTSEKAYSTRAIASFVLSLVAFLSFWIFAIIAGLNEASSELVYIIFGLLMLFGMIINIIGIGLGLTSVTKKQTNKVLAVTGIILNSVHLLFVIMIFMLPL